MGSTALYDIGWNNRSHSAPLPPLDATTLQTEP